MLMNLSSIPRDILERFEEDYQQEADRNNYNWITGMLKKRYIELKVVQTIKRFYRELDERKK
jgi:hypothetical protein